MEPSAVKTQVRQFIMDNFLFGGSDADLGENDSFLDKGIIDSTGVLELVAFVEETYYMKVADDELIPENLDSVNQLTAFILRRNGSQ